MSFFDFLGFLRHFERLVTWKKSLGVKSSELIILASLSKGLFGKRMFKITQITTPTPAPLKAIEAPLTSGTSTNTVPPSPVIAKIAIRTIFLDKKSSSFAFTKIRKPLIAIMENKIISIPPITGLGIADKINEIGAKKENITAIIAAKKITQTDATLVTAITEVFSPYEVFAGPPIAAEKIVARPSPISVR